MTADSSPAGPGSAPAGDVEPGEGAPGPRGAVDLVTFGETMVLFQALHEGPLPYAPLFTRSIAGAESNVAIAMTRLGRRARWISRLGTDPFGDIVAGTLAAEGVDVAGVVRDASAPTAVFFREYKPFIDPNVYYYRSGSAASRLSPRDVTPGWFSGARLLHVTGITPALGPETGDAVAAAMRLARDLGLLVSFDPNLRRKLWPDEVARRTLLDLLPLCDLFLPGIEEAEFLLGARDAADYGPALLDLGPKVVALKRGDQGSTAFADGRAVDADPYPAERVVDTIGAGDAFAAGFLSVWLGETDPMRPDPERLRCALDRANLMGSLATQFRGDWEGLPTLAEIERIRAGARRITR